MSRIKIVVMGMLCLSSGGVKAQTPDSTLRVQMSEVTVIGAKSRAVKDASPMLVGVIDNSEMAATASSCLAQGLNFSPGLRVETGCENCGLTQVRMNGLDGHYSQILMDSHPVFPSLLSVYGLDLIPTSQIERIEVVRGGGLLGWSSAIGGTINLVTKEATKNSLQLSHLIEGRRGWNSFENTTALNASIANGANTAGSLVYVQLRHRGNWDANADGYSEITRLSNHVAGINSYLKCGNFKYGLQLHSINSDSRGGNNLDLAPFESNIAEMVRYRVNGGMATVDYHDSGNRAEGYLSIDDVSRDSYYGGIGGGSEEERAAALLAYGKTQSVTVLGGVKNDWTLASFPDAHVAAGAEYRYDRLNDFATGYGIRNIQTVKVGSLYAEAKYGSGKWRLSLGLRGDKHNLMGKIMFRPVALVCYSMTPRILLRAGYASGYRAPEVYDEDLHVSMVGGERVKTVLAEDLKAERSHSFTFSCDSYLTTGIFKWNLSGEGFYNILSHSFDNRYLPDNDVNGFALLERYNSVGARVWGVNAELAGSVDDLMHFDVGATIQDSRYNEPRRWSEDAAPTDKMFRSPDAYGYGSMCFHIGKRCEMCLSGIYTGRMWVQHSAGSGVEQDVAVSTPQFLQVNINAEYHIPVAATVDMTLTVGAKNLFNSYQRDFDCGASRDSGYIYGPSVPFSPYLGLRIAL